MYPKCIIAQDADPMRWDSYMAISVRMVSKPFMECKSDP
jgi:hypothetical protein